MSHKHTPTPWELEQDSWISGLHSHRRSIVASCNDDGVIPAEAQAANAAFIVKACNSHDALVKALTLTLSELSSCARQLESMGRCWRPDSSVAKAQEAARAILGDVGGPDRG